MKSSVKYVSGVTLAILVLTSVWAVPDISLSGLYDTNELIAPADSDTTVILPYPFPDRNNEPPPAFHYNSPLYLSNPSNINTTYEYDPFNQIYHVDEKIGSLYFRDPSYLTFDEFVQNEFRNSTRNYWVQRSGEEQQIQRRGLIPTLHVGGEAFDRIFGGNTVDIRPQGSAELIFGANISNNENPALPENQRRLTTFDFKQKIQMNVIGKIGEKLRITTNYNTEATFDFENQMKLEYTGYEDEIIQKIEAGNVTLPLAGTLITGSQSLFGIKTALKFGRLTMTSIFSQQKGKTSSIQVTGGAQTNTFDIPADQYEANRHYFIAEYFKDNYDNALSNLPIINSVVNINKIEVWITNKTGVTENTRNIIGFMDLGEPDPYLTTVIASGGGVYPRNDGNDLYFQVNQNLPDRDLSDVQDLNAFGLSSSRDYEPLEYARMLTPTEFTYHSQLGYISLNQALNADEVLAVAFEYSVGNNLFKVGDLTTDGVNPPKALFVKLLKSTMVSPKIADLNNPGFVPHPLWTLMMKNIYSIGAFQVQQKDFKLDVVYFDNNIGTSIPYIPVNNEPQISGIPLLRVMNLDRLNVQGDPQPDGVFDYVEGITIRSQNGRIIFPVREPFGEHLRTEFTNPVNANNYVFEELYDSTKTVAQQLYPHKNKFSLRGEYQSSSSSDISLNAFNIPQGSVTVTAGGIKLTENVDYTVDYNLGRVRIINQGILNSGTPIDISLESNSLFSIQSKTLMGTRFDYEINKDFALGGTVLHLNERPLTRKVNFGDEPISNTIWGVDGTYRTDSRFLTKLVDKLPFLETKEISSVTVTGEFAQFVPGHPKSITKEGAAYIDDFEGSQSSIDLKNVGTWFHASTPQLQPDLFPEGDLVNDLKFGFNRAKFAWYVVDPLFYRDNDLTPSHITNDDLSNHYVREVLETEIFPNKQSSTGQATTLSVLNLAYYPREKGPYNYDAAGEPGISSGINADGTLADPETRWAGIQRRIETTDFEAANVEFIEFWLLDPFLTGPTGGAGPSSGELYFNLGNVSEDVLRDGKKSFENGLPHPNNPAPIDSTNWGLVPGNQAIVNAFDNDPASRPYQDIGLDGLSSIAELNFFQQQYIDIIANTYGTGSVAYQQATTDPSSDDFIYFRHPTHDSNQESIAGRYKRYNNPEGNSQTTDQTGLEYPTASTNMPDNEDINRDNTLSISESYFQYRVRLSPADLVVGQNFITDKIEATKKLPNGNVETVAWYQFKVPVKNPERVVGNIEDYKSIRFIRMFVKGFEQEVILRFAKLQLVRGEWRKYNFSLLYPGEYITDDDFNATTFDVTTVNIEENSTKSPIPYDLPPGIDREINTGTSNLQQLNEQSLSIRVCNLQDGDARATYKNTQFDVRNYKKIKMFVHAEAGPNTVLYDNDLRLFVRLGTDFNSNYYEYEIPLKVTVPPTTDPYAIWPAGNEMIIDIESLQKVKVERNQTFQGQGPLNQPYTVSITDENGNQRYISIVGNPDLSNVRTLMIGVRNPKHVMTGDDDDGLAKCAEIWVNELRLSDFDEQGGWAANTRVTTKLADFANVSLAGNRSTFGWGKLEQKLNERSKDNLTSYDVSSTFQVGKFFPEKIGLSIPMYLGFSEAFRDPQWNPLDPDILLQNSLDATETKAQRDSIKRLTQDYTKRRSINFTNVRKEKGPGSTKSRIYDVENLSLTYAYTEEFNRTPTVEFDTRRTYTGAVGYNFNAQPTSITPFSKVNFGRSNYFGLIKDFNFNLKPSTLAFRTDVNRVYNEAKQRNTTPFDIPIQPTYFKDFRMLRRYEYRHDLTKSLKLDFSALNNSRVDEPEGPLDTQEKRDSVKENFWKGGRNTQYHHTAGINYQLPLGKIPLLDWTTVNAKYTADYDWMAPSLNAISYGNTIQNSNRKEGTANFNMVTLYNKIPYFKRINTTKPGQKPPPRPPGDTTKPLRPIPRFVYHSAKALMSVKTFNLTVSESKGTLFPGFLPEHKYLGMDESFTAPGWGFIFGSQKDIRGEAVSNGWITNDTTLNNPYTRNNTLNINGRSNIEPFLGLRIELTANKNKSLNSSEYFRASSDGGFQSFSPTETGNYSISFITIKTAFAKDNADNSSDVFKEFAANRQVISDRLGPGYGVNSQEVLALSFLAAYTGNSASSIKPNVFPEIPIPNWRITYDGLSKMEWSKKYFSSVNLNHGYRSTYSVNSFTTNLEHILSGGTAVDINNDIIPRYQLGQLSLSEQFSPLIGVDMNWKNGLMTRVEYKRDRSISLMFSQIQVTEIKGQDLVLGLGYRIKKFRMPLKLFGRSTELENDLNLTADLSIRQNNTIVRKLLEDNNQLTAGTRIISIKTAADYVINERLNIRLFYDQTLTKPFISLSFPTSNTSVGISLRFTLAD